MADPLCPACDRSGAGKIAAESIYRYELERARYDAGDKPGWLRAAFDLAPADPPPGPQLRPMWPS